jgi:hypothetical protein
MQIFTSGSNIVSHQKYKPMIKDISFYIWFIAKIGKIFPNDNCNYVYIFLWRIAILAKNPWIVFWKNIVCMSKKQSQINLQLRYQFFVFACCSFYIFFSPSKNIS